MLERRALIALVAPCVLVLASATAGGASNERPPRWSPEGSAYDVGYRCRKGVAALYAKVGREDPEAAAELFAGRHAGDPRQPIFREGCRDALLGRPNKYDVSKPTARDSLVAVLEMWRFLGSFRWICFVVAALGVLGGALGPRLAARREASALETSLWAAGGGLIGCFAFASSLFVLGFVHFFADPPGAGETLVLALVVLALGLSFEYQSLARPRRSRA